jgi:hypothetical protein
MCLLDARIKNIRCCTILKKKSGRCLLLHLRWWLLPATLVLLLLLHGRLVAHRAAFRAAVGTHWTNGKLVMLGQSSRR